jgi:hypothetical protein
MKVYVAGPYTIGDVEKNIERAITAGEKIMMRGDYPFIPHLTHYWHLLYQHSWSYWMEYDMKWLDQCDALVRLPGESVGADKEVETAKRLGLKVFYGMEEYYQG